MSGPDDLVCPVCGDRGPGAFCPHDGARRVDAALLATDPLVGRVIGGRYTIERRLGEGGMGAVYLANQAIVDRPVVIKIVLPQIGADPNVRSRFVLEARAASRVVHPNVVTIHDFGYTDDGLAYLVMERVDGVTLSDVLEDAARLPWRRACRLAAQVAHALAAAHALGIVHRDIKPGNVMVVGAPSDRELVKVLDFGLARMVASADPRLTASGAVVGTPVFMAPEQASGREVGPPTDVYALGVMLFTLVVGDPPFDADNPTDIMMKHLLEPAPTLREAAPLLVVPDELARLVARMLAKRPDERPDAAEVARALEALAQEPAIGVGPGAAGPVVRAPTVDLSRPTPEALRSPTVDLSAPVAPSPAPSEAIAPPAPSEAIAPPDIPGVPPRRGRRLVAWAVAASVLGVGALVAVLASGNDGGPGRVDAGSHASSPVAVGVDATPAVDVPAAHETVTPPPVPPLRGLRLDGVAIE